MEQRLCLRKKISREPWKPGKSNSGVPLRSKLLTIILSPIDKRRNFLGYGVTNVMHQTYQPVESAIAANDNVAQLLIALGGEVDVGCRRAHGNPNPRTIGDWAKFAVSTLDGRIKARKAELAALSTETVEVDVVVVEGGAKSWKTYLADEEAKSVKANPNPAVNVQQTLQDDIPRLEETLDYLQDINIALVARNAKTWNEVYPDQLTTPDATTYTNNYAVPVKFPDPPPTYATLTTYGNGQAVPQHQVTLYDELFEACFTGDNEKVQELCLPVEGKHKNLYPLHIFVQVANSAHLYPQTGKFPRPSPIKHHQLTGVN